VKQRYPVFAVAVVDAMPLKVAFAGSVSWEGKEKWRTIKTVFLTKLLKLFRRRLFTQDRNRRIAGYEFDEQCDQRNYRPNYEQKDRKAPQSPQEFMLEK
jgi:hypothetical protein